MGILCFFMGCGGVVEHRQTVSDSMLRDTGCYGEEEHDEGTAIEDDELDDAAHLGITA